MGEVYYATLIREGGFSKPLVIKRALPQYVEKPDFIRRFLEEARLSARLNHRNIVHIYDFGREEGIYYLAMEYVDGVSLDKLYGAIERSEETLSMSLWSYIALEALEALGYAHGHRDEEGESKPVIHRDVTPGNIFCSRSGEVKIGDFGLALAGKNDAGGIVGTLMYMAPEQAAGLPADERSDLFGLAASLYEGLCAKPPRNFEGMSESDKIDYIRNTPVIPPSERGAGIDADIEGWLMRALNLKPKERFPSAQVMQKELKEIIARRGWQDSANELNALINRFAPEMDKSASGLIEATRVADAPLSPSLEAEEKEYTFLKSKRWISRAIAGGILVAALTAIIWSGAVFYSARKETTEKEKEKPPLTVSISGSETKPAIEPRREIQKEIIIEEAKETAPPRRSPVRTASATGGATKDSTRRAEANPRGDSSPEPTFSSDYLVVFNITRGKIASVDDSPWQGGKDVPANAGTKIIRMANDAGSHNLVIRLQFHNPEERSDGFWMTLGTTPWLNLSLNGISLTDEGSRTKRELLFGQHRIIVYDDKGDASIAATLNIKSKENLGR